MKNKMLLPVIGIIATLALALGVSALMSANGAVEKTMDMQGSMMNMMVSMDKMMEHCEKIMGSGMMSTVKPDGMSEDEHASHHQ